MTSVLKIERLGALRAKASLARALSALEARPTDPAIALLLDEALSGPSGAVVGLTGPPGVGKSSLIDALIPEARRRALTVAVLAVDPSSARTGGALLGDRTRLSHDPEDAGVFVRSLAAGRSLGGLADVAFPAIVLLSAAADLVLVETVGVGQSETEIRAVADAVALCLQPGSGDALQFMKAGVMETPDLALVTKADLGASARRAAADAAAALTLAEGCPPPVALVAARPTEGAAIGVAEALDSMLAAAEPNRTPHARAARARRWAHAAVGADARNLFRPAIDAATASSLRSQPGPFSARADAARRLFEAAHEIAARMAAGSEAGPR